MDQTTEPLVVGVRFGKVGKVYHFAADTVTDIKVGDMVVVETSRGWQLGQVAQIVPNAKTTQEAYKPIDRRATPRDLLLRQMWQMKESEVVSSCRERATNLNLAGIKIVSAEYSFDGSRLTIQFSSETEEKYELKSLRQDMQKMFAPSQVEMRQIGPRDVAKTVCGMGACGLETRCCCLFLTEFSSISIRMAKEQGISLTPSEITGMCGRLRCCLIYEYDTYVDARSKLPKRNKRVRTPQGDGKVVDVVPLRGAVVVDLPEVGYREFPGDEVQLLDESGAVQTPPAPFVGTQQASAMDQAITGDETKKPFVISADSPPPDSDWENPPSVTEPRSMPRPERPHPEPPRQDRQRPDQRREGRMQRPGGPWKGPRDQAAPEGNTPAGPGTKPGGTQPGNEQRERGPRPGRGPQGNRPQAGGKGPRREGRPQGQQGGAQPRDPQGGKPRPRGETGGDTPAGGSSNRTPFERGDRNSQKRKGRQRDNNDGENRT